MNTLLGPARWAAAGAALAAVVHLWMATAGGWMALLGLGMAAACAPCAWHLWRRPTVSASRLVLGMSLGMVAVHTAVVLGGAGAAAAPSGAHVHGGSPAISGAEAHAAHTGTMLVVIGVELVSALLAAAAVRSARRRSGAVAAGV